MTRFRLDLTEGPTGPKSVEDSFALLWRQLVHGHRVSRRLRRISSTYVAAFGLRLTAKEFCLERELRWMISLRAFDRASRSLTTYVLFVAFVTLAAIVPTAARAAAPPPGATTFTFTNVDGGHIFVYRWLPAGPAKGTILIVHGLAEHAGRYARFAAALNAAGYAVYAPDDRGHGHSVAPGMLGDGGHDPFNGTERDLALLSIIIRGEVDKPLFIFGHSLGSLFTQRFIELHGSDLAGAVLSGTFGAIPNLPAVVAQIDAGSAGPAALQRTIAPTLFATYNKPFGNRTPFEWLSRDPVEVDKYTHDPLSGFAVTNEYVDGFFHGAEDTWDPANEALIPVSLPILIFGGDMDPVGGNTLSVKALQSRYQAHGIKDLTVTFYPGGRHEMLNETNRDQVTADTIAWFDAHLPKP